MKKSEKETFAVTRKLGGDATFPTNKRVITVNLFNSLRIIYSGK
jgi:hypothetical protein